MEENTLYLVNNLMDFYQGNFSGIENLNEIGRKGDFGLGTFEHLDGEMIFDRGVFYQVKADESILIPEGHVKAPYAQVTFFKNEKEIKLIEQNLEDSDFEEIMNRELGDLEKNYAIKITGQCENLTLRSVKKQKLPYPSLDEAISHQIIFQKRTGLQNGTFIGFRLSNGTLNGTNWKNYHFHYISDDKKIGGHVLKYKLKSFKTEWMTLSKIQVGTLPPCCNPN